MKQVNKVWLVKDIDDMTLKTVYKVCYEVNGLYFTDRKFKYLKTAGVYVLNHFTANEYNVVEVKNEIY